MKKGLGLIAISMWILVDCVLVMVAHKQKFQPVAAYLQKKLDDLKELRSLVESFARFGSSANGPYRL